MVEFRLPPASRPHAGKTWPAPESASRCKRFQVYRWDPDKGGNPTRDVYSIDLDACGPMGAEDIRPALERALLAMQQGQPAVVNVVTDARARAHTTGYTRYET